MQKIINPILFLFISLLITNSFAVSSQIQTDDKMKSGTWIWGCDFPNKSPKLQNLFIDNSIFTDIYMACGYTLLPGGVLKMPTNYTNIIENINLYHNNEIRFHPLVLGCNTVEKLRDLVYYPDRVDKFVDMLYSDAIFYNYDGYNFDFEYSDFNETDSIKFTELLEKLSIKINSGFNRTISTDIGGTEYPNVVLDRINKTNIIAINMATYTQNFTEFSNELLNQFDTLALKNSAVGLSCSHYSWDHPPTMKEVYNRLSLIRDLGIKHVSLFCSWGDVLKNWSWIDGYVEVLPEFV